MPFVSSLLLPGEDQGADGSGLACGRRGLAQALKQGQGEGGCLASAGLGTCEQVVPGKNDHAHLLSRLAPADIDTEFNPSAKAAAAGS